MAQQNKMYAGDYDSQSDGWPPPSAGAAGYDLKPCPFCGKKLFIVDRKNNPYARCSSDECYGRKLPLLNLDDPGAIKAWNKRS